jgi:hypothetical protein
MLAFSEIIDFLLTLMRDETARAEFEQDPQGTLARAGLEGVTGQDISDARLLLADSGSVRGTGDDGGSSARSSYQDDPDPVRQINYTTQHYHVEDSGPADSGGEAEPNLLLQQSSTSLSIDDRDSFFFQTVNSDDDVTIVEDSFNTIDNSSVDATITNIDADNSFNTSDDDVVAIDADNSFNSSDDDNVVAIRDDDTIIEDNDVVLENSFNQPEATDGSLAAVSPPSQLPPAEPTSAPDPAAGEQAAQEPAAEEPAAEEPAFEEPAAEEPAFEEPAFEEPAADDPVDDQADEPADPAAGDAADALPV